LFKDLHRLLQEQQQPEARQKLFSGLRDKPFWIWSIEEHKLEHARTDGDCCFNLYEEAEYDKVIARYRTEGWGDKDGWTRNMKIVPVNFNSEHKAMLGHVKMLMEDKEGRIAINPDKFDRLITSLRTAVDQDGTLDKEATSYNDIFDAFRLALKFYRFEQK
jgi:hypothetical protein